MSLARSWLIASVLAIPPSPESEAATKLRPILSPPIEKRAAEGRRGEGQLAQAAGFEVPAVGKPMPDMHFTLQGAEVWAAFPTAAAQVIRRRRAQGVQALVEGEATQEKSTFEDPVVAGAQAQPALAVVCHPLAGHADPVVLAAQLELA